MKTALQNDIVSQGDFAHEARRFRTILKSFERNLELLFKDHGKAPEVDHAALATAFAQWRNRFDATKHLAEINRHDFVIYAAGLMLKELIAAKPLLVAPDMVPLPGSHALNHWPEGYAYTSFCLSVAAAILKEIGDSEPLDQGISDDPAFWASFRENALESPAIAVAFFDLVCGRDPNWDAPDVPWLRNALRGGTLLQAPSDGQTSIAPR